MLVDTHFLITYNERDVTNMVNQSDVLWNVQMIKVPSNCIVTESRRVTPAQEKSMTVHSCLTW